MFWLCLVEKSTHLKFNTSHLKIGLKAGQRIFFQPSIFSKYVRLPLCNQNFSTEKNEPHRPSIRYTTCRSKGPTLFLLQQPAKSFSLGVLVFFFRWNPRGRIQQDALKKIAQGICNYMLFINLHPSKKKYETTIKHQLLVFFFVFHYLPRKSLFSQSPHVFFFGGGPNVTFTFCLAAFSERTRI